MQNKPSIFKMVKQFASEVTEYVKNGAPNVTLEQYAERLDICKSCSWYSENMARCNNCGCFLEAKAKWKTSTCPLNPPKWPDLMEGKKPEDFMPEPEPTENPFAEGEREWQERLDKEKNGKR